MKMYWHRLLIAVLKPFINRVVWKHLKGRLDDDLVRAVIKETWSRFYSIRDEMDPQPNFGARLMVELAVLTEAYYYSLEDIFGPDFSQYNVKEAAWDIYKKLGRFTYWIAGVGLRNSSPFRKLERSTRIFRKFPFSRPSYQWHDIPGREGVVAFDCVKCPVAEYFIKKGSGHICANTWCKLDFRLAAIWGGKLKLSGTIAQGERSCNFRWSVD